MFRVKERKKSDTVPTLVEVHSFVMLSILVHLTQSTAVQFNSHGNVAVPTPDINSHETSHKWPEETMNHHKVPLDIGFEYLKQKGTLILFIISTHSVIITFQIASKNAGTITTIRLANICTAYTRSATP